MKKPVIGYAGLTHLGLNSAVASASRGFRTVGYHDDIDMVECLSRNELPISEPNLALNMETYRSKLEFSPDPEVLAECDIIYIAVDVPTDKNGVSDLKPIYEIVEIVLKVLKNRALLIILCQVPPGFTRSIKLTPERLFYQVETLIFGRALSRAMYPERFIIGCAEPLIPMEPRLKTFLSAFECPILPMRYESAELAKISINLCLVASVSVANTLAELSEAIGADWSEIIPALKMDKRIGSHAYLEPGLGISGGNLERDLRTVINIGHKRKTDVGIVEAWIKNSIHRKEWLWQTLCDAVLTDTPDARVALLGLAYKENTNSTKNSPSLQLLSHLAGCRVRVHDPVVLETEFSFAETAPDALSCAQDADVLIIATPWQEYRGLLPSTLAEMMKGRVLIDPYRIIDESSAIEAGFSLYSLGTQPIN